MGGTAEMFKHFSSRMRMIGVYFYLWRNFYDYRIKKSSEQKRRVGAD